uniref:Uncharacterized protein n=1 Tax=Arundo donax TaxID=35708 RepID=A0A0A9EW65_ARUDO
MLLKQRYIHQPDVLTWLTVSFSFG